MLSSTTVGSPKGGRMKGFQRRADLSAGQRNVAVSPEKIGGSIRRAGIDVANPDETRRQKGGPTSGGQKVDK